MLSQEEIDQQLQLIRTYRRTLAVLLQQQAAIGKTFSPPSVITGIQEARSDIKRIKTALQSAGVVVPMDLNDEDPPDTLLVLRGKPQRTWLVALVAGAGGTLLVFIAIALFGTYSRGAANGQPTSPAASTQAPSGVAATAPTSPAANTQAPSGVAATAPATPGQAATAAAAPPGALLYEYTFSTGSAGGWAGSHDTWQVVDDNGNFVYQGQASITSLTASSPPETVAIASLHDYAIEARVRIVQTGLPNDNLADFWLALRAHNTANPCVEYDFNVFSAQREAFIFRNGPGDCFSTLAQAGLTFDPGTWYTIRAEVIGNQLKLFVNGAQVLAATDDRLSEGFFYLNVGSGAMVQFDDMRIYQLSH